MGNGSSAPSSAARRTSDRRRHLDSSEYDEEVDQAFRRERDSYYDRRSSSPSSIRRDSGYDDNKSLRYLGT